ncbi:class I SAM-dependent methyltransferase [Nocardia sp. NPDC003963]
MRELEQAGARIIEALREAATFRAEGIDRFSGRAAGFGRYMFRLNSEAELSMQRRLRTIDAYDRNIERYMESTPSSTYIEDEHGAGNWLESYVNQLQRNFQQTGRVQRVLDLASGPQGRDGRLYRESGFDVTLSDASPRSVEKLREAGFEAERIDMVTDEFGGPWDGISINGGVPHLSPRDLEKVVEKAARSLREGGLLAYSFKIADTPDSATHQVINNKGADKDYYLRDVDAFDPWELRYDLIPLATMRNPFDTGGTHEWGCKLLTKHSSLYETFTEEIDTGLAGR